MPNPCPTNTQPTPNQRLTNAQVTLGYFLIKLTIEVFQQFELIIKDLSNDNPLSPTHTQVFFSEK